MSFFSYLNANAVPLLLIGAGVYFVVSGIKNMVSKNNKYDLAEDDEGLFIKDEDLSGGKEDDFSDHSLKNKYESFFKSKKVVDDVWGEEDKKNQNNNLKYNYKESNVNRNSNDMEEVARNIINNHQNNNINK